MAFVRKNSHIKMACSISLTANSKWLGVKARQIEHGNKYFEVGTSEAVYIICGRMQRRSNETVKGLKRSGIIDFLAKYRNYEKPFYEKVNFSHQETLSHINTFDLNICLILGIFLCVRI